MGNDGANFIDGATARYLYGFGGNDIYIIETVGDVVIELANQGLDTIFTSISGRSTMTSSGSASRLHHHLCNHLTGNELANEGGAMTAPTSSTARRGRIMTALRQRRLFVDNANDIIIGRGRRHRHRLRSAAMRGRGCREVTVSDTGSTFAINLTAMREANEISGNQRRQRAERAGRKRLLIGNGGADTFAFTSSIYAGSIDQILDFQPAWTGSGWAPASSRGLRPGASPRRVMDRQRRGTTPTTDHLRRRHRRPYFDADGTGSTAQVQFANLSNGLALTASDFVVI